jgi:hypothetical protein
MFRDMEYDIVVSKWEILYKSTKPLEKGPKWSSVKKVDNKI